MRRETNEPAVSQSSLPTPVFINSQAHALCCLQQPVITESGADILGFFTPQSRLSVQSTSFILGQSTHTGIVLHGRGSNGEEFAEEFMASTLSSGQSLQEKLPGWRWVFPTSPELWSTAFQETMTAWFEAHSLSDITARQELQVDGLRESVRYISNILRDEIEKLHGDSEKVVLGGISQGGAAGLWTILCQEAPTVGILGGFFAASTWPPFASNVEQILAAQRRNNRVEEHEVAGHEFDGFVEIMMKKKN
ncbi:Phospholipase/Carboxylesterase-domain-containing protein [Xylaria nigripes]|nr:Phospholipase/Carboxylesterase-domain-containing protein [Xylaria nigripes]